MMFSADPLMLALISERTFSGDSAGLLESAMEHEILVQQHQIISGSSLLQKHQSERVFCVFEN